MEKKIEAMVEDKLNKFLDEAKRHLSLCHWTCLDILIATLQELRKASWSSSQASCGHVFQAMDGIWRHASMR